MLTLFQISILPAWISFHRYNFSVIAVITVFFQRLVKITRLPTTKKLSKLEVAAFSSMLLLKVVVLVAVVVVVVVSLLLLISKNWAWHLL